MRAAHAADPDGATAGVDVTTSGLGDMRQVGRRTLRLAPASSCCAGERRLLEPLPPLPLHAQLGIFEAFKVKHAALLSATEAAEMILRVDDIIRAAPRQRDGM